MIIPMIIKYAVEISHWKYENEYSIYSFQPHDETINDLLNGDYYVCLSEDDTMLGFFCFGDSARIPTIEENVYDENFLDIGLGMIPDLCGRGKGLLFVRSGLDFVEEKFKIKGLRLTVAAFNMRAIRVYEKIDFHLTKTVPIAKRETPSIS